MPSSYEEVPWRLVKSGSVGSWYIDPIILAQESYHPVVSSDSLQSVYELKMERGFRGSSLAAR